MPGRRQGALFGIGGGGVTAPLPAGGLSRSVLDHQIQQAHHNLSKDKKDVQLISMYRDNHISVDQDIIVG